MIWVNVTSGMAWTRPPVGIIKVERIICAGLEQLYGPSSLRKCVWQGGAFREWTGVPAGVVDFRPGDILLTMGLDWDYPYPDAFRRLAQERGVGIISFCYDLIPILFPHYCVDGVPEKFRGHFKALAAHAAGLVCISRQTEKDVTDYCRAMGYPARPTRVVTLGDDVPDDQGGAGPELERLMAEPFILFVSTIERRKNHETLYRAYHELARRGHAKALPRLVFVGAPGWGVNDLLKDIALDPLVQGRIAIVNRVSDGDLRRLYKKALFCAYPSLYEGWGLPIGEALSLGKAVLSSDRGSLPEVGGDLVRYIDPWDVRGWADAILDWVSHPEKIAESERRIAAAYVPRDWQGAVLTVKEVIEAQKRRAASALPDVAAGWPIPPAFLARTIPDLSAGETRKMAAFDKSKPLAFFHVPKTGGSALNSAFRQSLGEVKAVAADQDRSLFGPYDDFASWSPTEFKRMALSPAALESDAKYVSGHFAVSTILQGLPDAQLVTLLREPVSRLLSHWIYWRKVCEGNLDGFGSWAERLVLSRGTLSEFLSEPSIACQTDNVAVRMLLWPSPLIPDDDFIAPEHDEELLRQAMEMLDRFAMVGIYEDRNSTALFESFLGTKLQIKKENETAGISSRSATPLAGEMNDYAMGLVMSRCRLDFKIWSAWAEKRGLDAGTLFFSNILKNVSRFSVLLSGLSSTQRESDQLKQKVQALEQALATAQQVNNMLVEQMSANFTKPL